MFRYEKKLNPQITTCTPISKTSFRNNTDRSPLQTAGDRSWWFVSRMEMLKCQCPLQLLSTVYIPAHAEWVAQEISPGLHTLALRSPDISPLFSRPGHETPVHPPLAPYAADRVAEVGHVLPLYLSAAEDLLLFSKPQTLNWWLWRSTQQ